MSRFVVATAFGGPEVLTLSEEPDREPGSGEAVLDVRAAGINPADWKGYGGAWGRDASRLPMRLGFEAAGVVAAVGEGGTGPARPVSVGAGGIGLPRDRGRPRLGGGPPRPGRSVPGRRRGDRPRAARRLRRPAGRPDPVAGAQAGRPR